jgi:hypothetical protein
MYQLRWITDRDPTFSGTLEEIRDYINAKRGCNLKKVLPGLGAIPNRDFYEWKITDPSMRMKMWHREDNYMGKDYSDYFVLMGHTRDSDALTESNFHTALDMMGGESNTVIVARMNHWLVGWVEGIFIHKSDQEAIDKGEDILAQLEEYPVLDEDDYDRTRADMGEEEEFEESTTPP